MLRGLLAGWMGCGVAVAGPMDTLTHSGRLLGPTGDPLSGEHQIQVALYGQASGGLALWTSTPQSMQFDLGYYSVTLGDAGNPVLAEDIPQAGAWVEVRVDNQVSGQRAPISGAAYAVRAGEVPWTGVQGIPADVLDGDQDTPTADVAGNWGFEDGPVGDDIAGFLPGWDVQWSGSGAPQGMDHTSAIGRTGLGFGADQCCDPPVGRWSMYKHFLGNFDGSAVSVGVDAHGSPIDPLTCPAGQEYVAEDDGRIYLVAYDSAGSVLGNHYSERASRVRGLGTGDLGGGWVRVETTWTPPNGTRRVRVEIWSDDQNGNCIAEGGRGNGANAAMQWDNFHFETDGGNDRWVEYEQPMTLPGGL